MKKSLAAVLAVLCLAGCSAKEKPAEVPGETVMNPVETVETPVVEEIPVEEIIVEAPQEELVEEVPADSMDTVDYSADKLEGLVGDTIGYSIAVPKFEGFEAAQTVTEFYEKIGANLVEYTKNTVNEECLELGLMASVFGEITQTALVEDGLEIHYEFRVEFSNGDVKTNGRTDTFHLQTGEVESVTG